MRLQPDWCDIPLVLDAAISCLPPEWLGASDGQRATAAAGVWADHDRLEQVFVNLLEQRFRHNPPGTRVRVGAAELRRRARRDHGRRRRRRASRRSSLRAPFDSAAPPRCTQRRRRSRTVDRARDRRRRTAARSRSSRLPPARASGSSCRSRPPGAPQRRDRGRAARVCLTLRGATRALLIEDDPNIVDLIRSNLAVRGFDTIVSVDGSRALQLLETEEPDIVLLDLMLPDADGFELCRQIRERSSVGRDRRLGARRGARQGHRAEHGGRRLHDQAVQRRGAARADHGDAAAHARWRARRSRRRR